MLIVVPIGGCGQRFKDDGYTRPKPLVHVFGKPMLFWLLDSLKIHNTDTILVVYTNELSIYGIDYMIQKRYSYANIHCIELEQQTRGAAETVYLGIDKYKHMSGDMEVYCDTVILDCDTFYTCDILGICRSYVHNTIIYFNSIDNNPIYSYITIDDKQSVTDIREKEKISNNANTGCYKFGFYPYSWHYAQFAGKNKIDGELYMSKMYNCLIQTGANVKAHRIEPNDFHCLGTPLQVKLFTSNPSNIFIQYERKRICFDLDNTIIFHKDKNYLDDGVLNKPVVDILRYLKDNGHTIIIYTARRMRTHNNQVHKVIADIAPRTIEVLKKHDIPYDELYFGKPIADFYIDDLAIPTAEHLEKALGFTMTETYTRPRYFHNLSGTPDCVRKTTTIPGSLEGEIYWYMNIPSVVQHLFPVMYRYNGIHSFEMEKINGLPISYLYTEKSLTLKQFGEIMECLQQIHDSRGKNKKGNKENIYANYKDKLVERCDRSHLEELLDLPNTLHTRLECQLRNYESLDLGISGVIHGDPVFSNILLSMNGYKFIDMRGMLGSTPSIYGDIYYDYAKVYQSIMGYEHILVGKPIDYAYQKLFIDKFHSYFSSEQIYWIKIITASLLYTLLPIHIENIDICREFFHLAEKILHSCF